MTEVKKDLKNHYVSHFKCECDKWVEIVASEMDAQTAHAPCICGVSSTLDLSQENLGERFHLAPIEPKVDPCWPWALITKTVMKDGRVTEWRAQGFGSGAVSRIRVRYASGIQHYQFRRGKPIQIELEDAFTTYTLKRKANNENKKENRT